MLDNHTIIQIIADRMKCTPAMLNNKRTGNRNIIRCRIMICCALHEYKRYSKHQISDTTEFTLWVAEMAIARLRGGNFSNNKNFLDEYKEMKKVIDCYEVRLSVAS